MRSISYNGSILTDLISQLSPKDTAPAAPSAVGATKPKPFFNEIVKRVDTVVEMSIAEMSKVEMNIS